MHCVGRREPEGDVRDGHGGVSQGSSVYGWLGCDAKRVNVNNCIQLIARLLQRHRWVAYVGLAVILYVAVEMIYRGAMDVWM